MFEYIDPFVFFISLGVGIFLTYLVSPNPKIIYKYPTPSNAGKITYVDDAGVCYKYKSTKVNCPSDKSQVKSIDIQN